MHGIGEDFKGDCALHRPALLVHGGLEVGRPPSIFCSSLRASAALDACRALGWPSTMKMPAHFTVLSHLILALQHGYHFFCVDLPFCGAETIYVE